MNMKEHGLGISGSIFIANTVISVLSPESVSYNAFFSIFYFISTLWCFAEAFVSFTEDKDKVLSVMAMVVCGMFIIVTLTSMMNILLQYTV